jgi:hypothetical protein
MLFMLTDYIDGMLEFSSVRRIGGRSELGLTGFSKFQNSW